jgi:endonuclease/exonuclease/phosphatase family metal-dependent hydrolase
MPKSFFRKVSKNIFIVTNIILALCFLSGCYAYLVKPHLFWPAGLMGLSAFYFFLLLLLYFIFWLFVKPRWSLISLVAILLGFRPMMNFLPLRFFNSFSLEKKRGALRLMSWNVAQFDVLHAKKNPGVRDQMIELVNKYQPDVACFQEMVCEDSMVTRTHGNVNEYLKRMNFKDYFYSYNRKEDFWDFAHFGVIIFSRYPIINRQTVMWYPYDYNSIFQYADIAKGSDTFRLFNIHLQSLRFSRENLRYIDEPTVEDEESLKEQKSILGKFKTGFLKREVQANRVRAEINKSPYPVMVCGDFNDVPNSYAYHTIGEGMKNAFAEKGAWLGRTFSGIAPTLRIDNIFADKRYEVLQYVRVKKKLSDHFPILADLDLEK